MYVERVDAHASGLVAESIAALSMRCLVLRFTHIPTVEPMTTGTQNDATTSRIRPTLVGNRFTTRQLVHRIRVRYWKSASTCVEIAHHAQKDKSFCAHALSEVERLARARETYRKNRPKSWRWRPRSVLGSPPREGVHAVPTPHIAVNTHDVSHFVGRCFLCVDS